jgi:DNA (cytosine-5)-methyltransferase 1
VKIRVLDLFSGIGGFHLGLTRAGFEVESYFSEIDKYAIDVYSNNFKEATYVGSVTDVRGADLKRIDAITFGSPCQDFSLAGKRKGLGGDRSSLIGEAIRLISECRPRFFIWENVKGTFSSNDGADFWAIIQAFANIGGYRLEWQLLNTKWFLPQNRERIYLVGYIGDGSRGQVFPIGEDNGANNELSRQQGNICTLTTRYGADGNGSYITERKLDAQKVKVNSATNAGYEEATIGDSINLSVPTSKTRRGRVGKGVAQTLDTHCNQAVIGYSRDSKGNVISRHEKQECNTLHSSSGTGNNTDQFIRQNRIRRLTPVECERLQGFPDNWTKYGQSGEISDSQRYKMCGNAVTVDVVKEVAKRIKTII